MLPTFAADQRLVCAHVSGAVPIEIAHVQSLPKYLVGGAFVKLVAMQGETLRAKLLNQSVEGVPARGEPIECLRDNRHGVWVGNDDPLAVRAVSVPVADGSETRIDASASLLQHALGGLLTQIKAVVACHQDLDPMHELLVGSGFRA